MGFGTSGLLFLLSYFGWEYARSVQRSCRILPEALASLPLWAGVAGILALMVLVGHGIRLAADFGGRLIDDRPPVARKLILAGGLVLALLIGWLLFEAFITLVENRAGRCRVTSSTGFPVYLIYMVVPLGFFLGGIQFFLAGLRNLVSRENYLSWYRRDEYEDEEQAAEQTSFGYSDEGDEIEREADRG